MALTIETERIDLRPWSLDGDLAAMSRVSGDPETMEFFPRTSTEAETRTFMEKANESIEKNGFGFFAAERREDGELLGFVGLSIPSFEASFCPCVEIGWRLHKDFWGQGYATEAAKACLEYGHGFKKLEEIVSFTSIHNKRSISVMKKI